MRGGQRPLTVTHQEHCRTCKGLGRLHVAESRCTSCHGSGVVKSARGHMVFSRPCAQCGGSGRERQTVCPACDGQQVETRTEPLTINVPPGLADGARIRVPAKGTSAATAARTAISTSPCTCSRIRCSGAKATTCTWSCRWPFTRPRSGPESTCRRSRGRRVCACRPGTQSGQRFRMRERGVPSNRHGRRGDLVIEVRLVLPKLLDERSKELLREFGKINSEDVRKELAKR